MTVASDERAVALLKGAVAIDSPSRHERPVAEFLAAQMREFGWESRIDEAGNAVGERRGPAADGPGRTLVMLGHMDTAPGKVPVRTEGDLFYGRGAVDAKGPLCAFIAGGARAALPPGSRLIVVGAVEEESATSKGARFAATQYAPDACLIGEPSGWDAVTLGYKGRLLCEYVAVQDSGHTAGPEAPVAHRAVDWINAVRAHGERFNEGRTRLFDQLMVGVRDIRTSSDGLTDRVEVSMGFRLPPRFDIDAFEAFVREAAPGATVSFRGREVAWEDTRSSAAARALVRAIREEGGAPSFKLKTGTADLNVVGPVWKRPIVAYGPGDSRLDHTPNEHISLAEYLRSIRVVARAVEGLLGAG